MNEKEQQRDILNEETEKRLKQQHLGLQNLWLLENVQRVNTEENLNKYYALSLTTPLDDVLTQQAVFCSEYDKLSMIAEKVNELETQYIESRRESGAPGQMTDSDNSDDDQGANQTNAISLQSISNEGDEQKDDESNRRCCINFINGQCRSYGGEHQTMKCSCKANLLGETDEKQNEDTSLTMNDATSPDEKSAGGSVGETLGEWPEK